MKRMRKGEAILGRGPGMYADVADVPDLLVAMDTMARAQSDFDALPSAIRKRFGNSPVELVDFLNDPENDEEAIRLGFKVRNPESLAMEQAIKAQNSVVEETKTRKTKGAGDTVPSTTSTDD